MPLIRRTFAAAAMAAFGTTVGLAGSDPANAYVFGFSTTNAGNVLTTSGGTAPVDFSGWYDQTNTDTGFHDSTNPNYIVGKNESTPFDGSVFHDFWVFDISRLTGPVSSASFTVQSFTVATSFDG